MPIRRKFLDWKRPALEMAADELLDGRVAGGAADLAGLVAALPVGRAGRRLLEILVERSERDRFALFPPTILTVGGLPELLYTPQRPFADDLTQQLAWIEALKQTGRRRLAPFFGALPGDDDLFGWLSLGQLLAGLHQELAADTLDFADVASGGGALPGFDETDRWQTLAGVQDRYLKILDGLKLWDLQTARRVAVRQQECRTDKQIVLIGAVDLNRTQRSMLDQVAKNVTALVFAPQELSDRFDEHGCLRPEQWQDCRIDLARDRIRVVDAPGDQADAVIRAMAAMDGRFSADEITVGVPDERLVPVLQQRLDECGVPNRHGVGVPAARLGPCQLLRVVAEYLESRRADAFAELVRHPAVHRWLLSEDSNRERSTGKKDLSSHVLRGDWLTQLDHYLSTRLPTRLDAFRAGQPGTTRPDSEPAGENPQEPARVERQEPARVEPESTDNALLPQVYDRLTGGKGLLREFGASRRPLPDWSQAIVDLLAAVYGRAKLDRENRHHRATIAACDAIMGVLQQRESLHRDLRPSVTAAEALRLTLQAVSGERVPSRPEGAAVELLGWLELPLDDAPGLVVTAFNEGIVPKSRNSDLFLPNELRRQLGLEDNERVYARDAYALSVLAASREELTIIAGRRSADNDPLFPSRLLFACPPPEIAERTRELLDAETAGRRLLLPGSLKPGRSRPIFAPPPPDAEPQPLTSMRVTEFRDYLACPYRYYLRHRLGLEAADDATEELGGAEFGSLLHDVLKAFGQSDLKDADDPRELSEELNAVLQSLAKRLFGKHPTTAVSIQLEQMRLRLAGFARWQAEWRRAGWRIELTEHDIEEGKAPFPVDDVEVWLRGRIDRIDVNERTGECVVFDYKTGESPRPPEKAHRRQGEWVDLQLPLYRHLVRSVETITLGESGPGLGYIVIPKSVREIGHCLAEWTDQELAEADETARRVIRDIRHGRFFPPVKPPPPFFEEYAAICLDEQFGTATTAEGPEED